MVGVGSALDMDPVGSHGPDGGSIVDESSVTVPPMGTSVELVESMGHCPA